MRLSQIAIAGLLAALLGTLAYARDVPESGPAMDGSPAWFTDHAADIHVHNYETMCTEDTVKFCAGKSAEALRICLSTNKKRVSQSCQTALAMPWQEGGFDVSKTPPCAHSPVCVPRAVNNPGGVNGGTGVVSRVQWKSDPVNMGYRAIYPYEMPPGGGGATAVGMDSKGNLWVFQRVPPGMPELFKFGPDRKLLLALGDKELGAHQDKAHGLRVDAQDNVWICDANGATVKKISPDGKLLFTLGEHGRRGDWDEAKGQRLLWQPMAIAFARDGSAYIAEGHANESPNDVGSADPANRSGAARIIHVTSEGKFIAQWYGNINGQGKFSMAHDVAVDPQNGDVWIGDREQYRLVVYTADGQFVKTIQMRNLTCNVAFDAQGRLWVGTGQDGQLLQIDRNGKVLGAVGNGRGWGYGQLSETGYITWDRQGNMYTGATGQDRVTVWIKPGN
jgi:streptogramin lyase